MAIQEATVLSQMISRYTTEEKLAMTKAGNMAKNGGIPSGSQVTNEAKEGARLGVALDNAEQDFLAAIKSGKSDQIMASQVIFQAAQRAFEAFSTVMKKLDDIRRTIVANMH